MSGSKTGFSVGAGNTGPSAWTPARVEMLLDLWPRGYSASQAAAMIGGVSRNAVIGKVHRLKLPVRPRDSAAGRAVDPVIIARREQKSRERNARNINAKRAQMREQGAPESEMPKMADVDMTPPFEGSLRLSFEDLRADQCHFPEGKHPPFEFCGNPAAGGSSWCRHHQQIVWVKPEHRRATGPDGNRRGRKVSNYLGSHEAA